MIKTFNQTVRYIEEMLTDEIDEKLITQLSGYSYPLFSRIFSIMVGYTLSEYIRFRKLSRAAYDLRNGKEKVIEIAMKYGYDSPDSFTAAFRKFHGTTPKEVRNGKAFKIFSPIRLSLNITGGQEMEIRIERKKAFKIGGLKRAIEDSKECTELWEELLRKASHEELSSIGRGQSYGCCYNVKSEERFTYMAAYDVENEEKAQNLGLEIMEIPEAEYAVVKLKGAIPASIHDGWKYIMTTFFPEEGYSHAGTPDFEVYYEGNMKSEDYEMELWVPVVKDKG